MFINAKILDNFFKTTSLVTVPFCHPSSLFRDTVQVYMHTQVCTAQIYIHT